MCAIIQLLQNWNPSRHVSQGALQDTTFPFGKPQF